MPNRQLQSWAMDSSSFLRRVAGLLPIAQALRTESAARKMGDSRPQGWEKKVIFMNSWMILDCLFYVFFYVFSIYF